MSAFFPLIFSINPFFPISPLFNLVFSYSFSPKSLVSTRFILFPLQPFSLVPLTSYRELHSKSRSLMDDEWSKGCECMESALLLSSSVSRSLSLSLSLFVPSARPRQERNRNERSPRENTLAASRYIPDCPVYGAAMMEPTSGRSCTFRPGHKLVIFYEFYVATRQGSSEDTGGRCRLIEERH